MAEHALSFSDPVTPPASASSSGSTISFHSSWKWTPRPQRDWKARYVCDWRMARTDRGAGARLSNRAKKSCVRV